MRNIAAIMLLMRGCLACGLEAGLRLEGLPVDTAQVEAAIALVNAMTFEAPVEYQDVGVRLTLVYVSELKRSGFKNLLGLTETTADGPLVTVIKRGECLARSVLVHELVHVRYGDGAHKLGAKLWNAHVARINNQLMARFCPGEIMDGGAK